jgi:hypothetical protein
MKFVAPALILTLGVIVAAQVPTSVPSSAPAADPARQSETSSPVTLPTTESDTQPATQATTSAATLATTAPTSGPAGYASSVPAYRAFSSYSGRRDYFRPETSPSTLPSNNPLFKPKAYPRQYSAMLSRSIFIKGRQQVFDSGAIGERPPRPDLASTAPSGPTSSSFSEGMLVFNGASDANGHLVAFIENTGMNQIARYHVGDPVGQGAQGRITAITLDSIDYSVGSRVTHVGLGQNLNGQDVQILTTQPVAETFGSSGGAPGTTQPSSITPGGTPLSDIERRMREKRLKELGQ